MTHVYLVRDNIFGGDLIFADYDVACAKAKKIAEHERHYSEEELKTDVTEKLTVWYRGKYYNIPIVSVIKLEVLTS